MAVQQASADSADLGSALTGESTKPRRKPQSAWAMALGELRKDKLTLAATVVIAVISLLAILAGPISTALGVNPDDTNPSNTFGKPYVIPYIEWLIGTDPVTAPQLLGESGGTPHWMGTDRLGRDQLSRLLHGGRVSLGIAGAAGLLGLVLGVLVGTVAGFFGGVVDDIIMWVINTILSVPTIYLLIIVSAIFRPNPLTLVLFLGFLGWFGTARFMRGNVFKVKELDYTLAARALGSPNWRIMAQHVIPNSISVVIIVTATRIGTLILVEAVLSFLGLGVQAPTPTWGNMLRRTYNFFFLRDPLTGEFEALHLMWPPGVLIFISILCFYLIGDGLRDALDPTLRDKR